MAMLNAFVIAIYLGMMVIGTLIVSKLTKLNRKTEEMNRDLTAAIKQLTNELKKKTN